MKIELPIQVGAFYLWGADTSKVDTTKFTDPTVISIGIAFGVNVKNNIVRFYENWYQQHKSQKGLSSDNVELAYWSSLLEHNKIVMPSPFGTLDRYVLKGCKKGRTKNLIHGLFYALGSDGYIKEEWLDEYKAVMTDHNLTVKQEH